MTVGELLTRVSSYELTEWMVYYQLEPFGPERGDLNAGIVAATVANANRDPKKRKEPYRPQDFMPEFKGIEAGEPEAPSPTRLTQKWMDAVAALSAMSRKRENG